MSTSDTKRKDIEDFKSHYITEEMLASFLQQVNLSSSGDEEEVIMETWPTTKRSNMAFWMILLIFNSIPTSPSFVT